MSGFRRKPNYVCKNPQENFTFSAITSHLSNSSSSSFQMYLRTGVLHPQAIIPTFGVVKMYFRDRATFTSSTVLNRCSSRSGASEEHLWRFPYKLRNPHDPGALLEHCRNRKHITLLKNLARIKRGSKLGDYNNRITDRYCVFYLEHRSRKANHTTTDTSHSLVFPIRSKLKPFQRAFEGPIK